MINEVEMIMGLKQNDQRIQTKFFDTYYNKLRRYVRSKSQKFDRDDIDMIVSGSLAKVFRYIDSYKGKSNLESWVFVITRNTMVDYAKIKNRDRLRSTYHTDPLLLAQVSSYYEYYHINDAEVVFDKFLDTLNSKERSIMVSRSKGEKLKDIAVEVGVTESTIKWYVSYLVKNFKKFMEVYK